MRITRGGRLERKARALALSSNPLEMDASLDPTAVAALHDQVFPPLYRYVHFRTGDAALAEDVAAESFLRLLEAVRSGRGPNPARARGWLFGTASHLVADHFRRRFGRREDRLSEGLAAPGPDPSTLSELLEAERRMRSAMAHLTQDQQDVLALRFHAQMSVNEVAEILGKRPSAIKALQFRGLIALRRSLDDAP